MAKIELRTLMLSVMKRLNIDPNKKMSRHELWLVSLRMSQQILNPE